MLQETAAAQAGTPSPRTGASAYRPANDPLRPRREFVEHFADEEETERILRGNGRGRRIRRGLIPRTRNGWLAAGTAILLGLAGLTYAAYQGSKYVFHSPEFRIPSSRNIEVDGNSHLTRAQMLSVFGEDIDANIFRVPLEQRRAQLEAMPWVDHATVMRLLPNRIRVHVDERVPVAFARQGGNIGLVDANGVLLDVPQDAPVSYSFPVVSGLRADDSAAGRAERMRLFASFVKDMDSDGKGSSAQFSEIDLSDPEDVKALIPDGNNEVLVHFGSEHFLSRYRKYQDHIVEWRTQYPRLSSVDMRYERQVVLQMPPKDVSPAGSAMPASQANAGGKPVQTLSAAKIPAAPVHAAVSRPLVPEGSHPGAARPSHAPANSSTAKDAAMRKRVEAIKAWMAKREKTRAANHVAPSPSNQ